LRSGDVVILDNLATHKIQGVREVIEASGARLLYLPRIRRISIRSSPYGARSNKSCVAMPPAPTSNCFWPPKPPSSPSLPRTARGSFLAPITLHNKWNCSNVPLGKCTSTSSLLNRKLATRFLSNVTAGCDALKSLIPSSDSTRSSSYAVCAPQADPRLRVGSSFAFFIPKRNTEYVKFLKGSS
jgi:hypothetical protein